MLLFERKKLVFAIGVLVCFAIVIFLIVTLRGEPEPTVLFISSSEARDKINEHQDAFILDVRSHGEFAERRIPGAVNIHYTEIAAQQELLPQDRHAMIFVHCQVGRRAGFAANKLVELGFTNIIVFPGMIDWEGETVRD